MSAGKQPAQQQGSQRTHSRSLSGQLNSLFPSSSNRRASQDASGSRRTSQDTSSKRPAQESHFIIPDARWETSVGNIEEARVNFEVITRAIEDAVYLDEDAYKEIAPTMQFTKVIRAQHRKIEHLEAELRDTRSKLEESNAVQSEALQRHAEMQQEIENNAVVFQMHYQELLRKDDEIRKLTAVIQALSGK